ncbi:MAG: sulfatase-like hydrolase/transferase [Opitutales bacterium]|jgi:iduronate 2-sulfatase|nr:sulfatase-like hydrolase/transferase [Opitutales bacterium]MDP4788107.1 sulfatase-like hydrolase/transferase [Opitutales bacterium]
MRAFAFLTSGLIAVLAHAAETKRPNVLFIAVDDLRPEVNASGSNVIKTPNLDRIAARGTTFDRAYCQQAVCSPSRSSLMTGRRPDATRVWDLETHFRTALPDAATVAQYFKNHGYHSMSMGKIFHGGFDDPQSWSVPSQYPKSPQYASEAALKMQNDPANTDKKGRARGPAVEDADVPDDTYADGKIARLAVKTLGELKQSTKPFFLAVGMLKPHLPFVAPKKYWDLYDPAKIYVPAFQKLPAGAPGFVGHTNGELASYADIPKNGVIDDALARRLRHGYYAAISYMDAQVGLVLDALEKEGLADNTVIVLWGDHGWQLGEHGLWHKHTNFEVSARSPLIISAPGQKAVGRKSLSLAEFIDIYPTLADLCGLPKPKDVEGVSLKPVLDDAAASVRPVAISQYPRSDGGKSLMGYSIRDDRWRLTLWRDRKDNSIHATELYDEVSDPHETVNVATKPEHAEVIARLSKFLPPPIAPATAQNTAAPAGKKGKAGKGAAKGDPKAGTRDRGAMFDGRDLNKDGKLNKEEFMLHQKDPEQAAKNFVKFDKDLSGDVNREEYVKSGK